ncbi:RnfABCDGE type electron transport complex subunit G [uncultured Ezakiella sp.]|uniref:RnfABCDGE type electron transport complex subunit G n=1 Tax=uncultured Ezakiella sp. TaxID=1637529 RepID=UPI0025DA0CA7|nr:RnfABCDGE type electron transport complex subunit G [uncultured Ezakiella sp.]
MKETIKLGIILLVFALVAAGVLGYVNSVTEPIIAEREASEAKAAYQELIPEADEFVEFTSEELNEYKAINSKVTNIVKAIKGGDEIGYLLTTNGGGYGGDITAITALIGDEIKAIKILKHKETPEIGTKVDNPDFQAQYSGKSVREPIAVKKENPGASEIQAITGSTVSSRGVTDAVNIALDIYKELNNGL